MPYKDIYTEPQKKGRNFNNSIRYGKQSIYFFSLNYKFFIATQGVGIHHKMLSNNKLQLHQNFIITHIYRRFHCINERRTENCIFLYDVSFAVQYTYYHTSVPTVKVIGTGDCVQHGYKWYGLYLPANLNL